MKLLYGWLIESEIWELTYGFAFIIISAQLSATFDAEDHAAR